MGWTRPTRAQLILESQQDLVSRFAGTGLPLPRSVLTILATSWAAGLDGAYGAVEQVSKNILPDSSDADTLVRQAADRGLSQGLATAASGPVIFNGDLGSFMAAGTTIICGSLTYTTDTDLTVTSGTTVIGSVTASVAGSASNLPEGTAVTLGASVPGFQINATVGDGGIIDGNDVQPVEQLRSEVLEFDQDEPTGGNIKDYVNWALTQPGVTRAWAYKDYSGAGTVGLTFVKDNDPTSIIPTTGDVAAMQAFIDGIAPATATNVVFAPTAVPLNPHIHLVTADTTAIRASVKAELQFMISSGIQADGSLGTAPGGTTYLNSQIIPAIASAPGVVDFTLSQLAGASPADVVMAAGSILTLGTPVFS